jgi:hypothetical protein
MTVIIGVDPHKQSHTAVAICGEEREVAKVTVRATCQQTAKLLAWAEPFEERTWAIESARGLGYLLAQQLVDVESTSSMSRRPWPRGSGCSAPVVRRRTTPMMHTPWQSPPCVLRASVGSKRPSTARSCGCWPSATTTWAGCGPG